MGAACGGAAGGLIDWVVVGAAGAGAGADVVVDEEVVDEELAADVVCRSSPWTVRWAR